MKSCVLENEAITESIELLKLEAFDFAINMSDRFSILGLDETEENFILKDAKFDEDLEMSCVLVNIKEVMTAPLKDVMQVLNGERNAIVLNGVTRIVGYYSRINNWNKSKIGEQRSRIEGRQYGGYGFNGTGVDATAYNDALAMVNNL